MKKILISFFTLASFSLAAQTYSILGVVADEANKPLPGAHVNISYPWDEIVQATVTEADGSFEFSNIPNGGYAIHISFLGYENFKKEITVSNQNISMGFIQLEEGSVNLNEVQVTENIPLAVQDGDTTSYNADAFKTLPDASAEDLISKMPGVVIENGKVQAQGEDVKEVLVDGRPFFGNDPTAALRNLPAEVVGKIQVFDQRSDQANFSGFDDGETSKTINIITRPGMRNGQFGKITAGYGYEDKYQASGNTSFFDGARRISIIGMSNNVNQQNFASEDLLGVSGGGGRGRGGRSRGGRGGSRGGGSRGGGGSSSDFLVQQQGGIATTNAFGINYSDNWGKKFEISGSYFFNISDNDSEDDLNREYIDVEGSSEIYDEFNTAQTENLNHRLNFKLEYQIDSANSIIMRPRLTMQQNNGFSTTFGETNLNNNLLNQTDNNFTSDLSAINFSNSLTFRHKFKKRGRTFSIGINSGYNDNLGESFLKSQDLFMVHNVLNTDTLDQLSDLTTKGWNLSSNFSYTEPLSEKASLMFNYRASWRDDDSDKTTFDYEEETLSYTLFNEQLTNVFTNEYFTQQVGGGYNYRVGRDLFIMARANAEWASLESQETYPDQTDPIVRDYFNILPMFMVRYNFSKHENMRLFYRTNTQNPSVNQLQNVVDNSNPLQLSVGNPNLDQATQHRLYLRYSKTNVEKATIFYFLISGSYSNNYIANSIYSSRSGHPIFEDLEVQPGTQLTQPVNIDGYWNVRSFITYGIPLKKIKTNLNLDLSGNYTRSPGIIEDVQNFSDTKTVGLGLTFSSNISDKFDFTISSRSSLNNSTNSIQSGLNTKYLTQNSRFKIGMILSKGIVFRTSIVHQLYSGLSEGFEDNYFLWNAGIGKKIFKNQRGEITLSVFDMLNQNRSISRNVTEVYIEDTRSIVLQRYLMLSFTYNFRNFATKKQIQPREEKRGGWDQSRSRGGRG